MLLLIAPTGSSITLEESAAGGLASWIGQSTFREALTNTYLQVAVIGADAHFFIADGLYRALHGADTDAVALGQTFPTEQRVTSCSAADSPQMRVSPKLAHARCSTTCGCLLLCASCVRRTS